jgi:hypothetical protein
MTAAHPLLPFISLPVCSHNPWRPCKRPIASADLTDPALRTLPAAANGTGHADRGDGLLPTRWAPVALVPRLNGLCVTSYAYSAAASGSIKSGSLFLTLPTRVLTG